MDMTAADVFRDPNGEYMLGVFDDLRAALLMGMDSVECRMGNEFSPNVRSR